MDHVAEVTEIPTAEIYGVATFYSYFKQRPRASIAYPCAWEPPATSAEQRRYWRPFKNSRRHPGNHRG